MFIFPKPLSLQQFESDCHKTTALRNISALRKEIEVVAIDDQPFEAETNLKNAGFRISVLRDIQRINEIDKYQIILCDINGVGLQLSPESQGAYVIGEIKKEYPEKVVIAYTAGAYNTKLVKKARAGADGYLKKDASIDDWRDTLDDQIKKLVDPVHTWKGLRLRLFSANIELRDMLELEHVFIKSFKNGPTQTRSKLEGYLKKKEGLQWTSLLGKFILSKGFELAFSALSDKI